MSTKALMTVEQLEQMETLAEMGTGQTGDYELLEGELISLPSATPGHARIRRLTERALENYLNLNPIGRVYGEIDCQLAADTRCRPDLSLFLGTIEEDRIPVPFAPDIAVEVLSPSEKAIGVRHKVRVYLGAGTREVWLIDPSNAEVSVQTLARVRILHGADRLESALLPGFSVSVAELIS